MINSALPKSILVVEDSDCYQLLLEEAFSLLDFSPQLTLVSTAEDALVWLEQRISCPPDLIFLDLHLPKMSGHDLLKIIKNDVKMAWIPVLILSDSIEPKEILESYQLQANCHLRKPINIDDLLYCLQTIFNFWFSVATLPKPLTKSNSLISFS